MDADRGSAGAEPVLLSTKLEPPRPRGLLNRAELVGTLHGAMRRRVTLVEAPAGWGKTSLLAAWRASAAGQEIGWLALDAEDNDPTRFWSYLVAALGAARPGFAPGARAALRSHPEALRAAVLPALINELAGVPRDIVLLLDDYHVISEPEVHHSVSYLLTHQPPQLRLVIATRSDPALPLARLRAAGELTEIRARDLRFTAAEANALLNGRLALGLSTAEVERLCARTEGWPAGLYLAALSMQDRVGSARRTAFVDDFTGTDRFVLDYLLGEVLGALPAELHDFLLRTSILHRFCGGLCDAVTGHTGSAKLLDTVARRNLFVVPLDSEPGWYRYHALFGELLRHELALDRPEEVTTLHRRAAAWFVRCGDVGGGIEHSVAAGQPAEAAELIAEHWTGYFNLGLLTTVDTWLDRLPAEVVTGDPRLCLARAWVLLDRGRLAEAGRWIGAADGPSTARDAAVVRAVHRFKIGDVAAARRAARRVLELGRGEPGFAAAVAYAVLGLTTYWSGDSRAALGPLGEAVRLCRQLDNRLGEAYALGYLSIARLEAGDLDEADRSASLGLRAVRDPAVGDHFVAALPHAADALVSSAAGRPEDAAGSAERAVLLAGRGAGRLELALAHVVRAEVQAGAAGAEAASAGLAEARRLGRLCRDPGRLPELIARVSRLVAAVRGGGPRPPAPATDRVKLSEREGALVPLLAGTLSQREIGEVLHVSVNTIKTQTRVLYRKLGAGSRAEAVERARELGLLSPAAEPGRARLP